MNIQILRRYRFQLPCLLHKQYLETIKDIVGEGRYIECYSVGRADKNNTPPPVQNKKEYCYGSLYIVVFFYESNQANKSGLLPCLQCLSECRLGLEPLCQGEQVGYLQPGHLYI